MHPRRDRLLVPTLAGWLAATMLSAIVLLSAPRMATAASTGAPLPAWSQLSHFDRVSSARMANTLVFDSRRGRFVTVGGVIRTFSHGPILRYPVDLPTLSLADTGSWSGLDPIANAPRSEWGAAAYDSLTVQILYYGGAYQPDPFVNTFDYPRTTYVLPLASPASWNALAPTASSPPGLQGASLVLDPLRRRMLLFGGRDDQAHATAQVWQFDLSSSSWSPLVVSGAAPPGRSQHLAVYDPGSDAMIATGGALENGSPATDSWRLSLGGIPTWSPIATTGTFPGGRTIGALDAQTGRLMAVVGPDTAIVWAL